MINLLMCFTPLFVLFLSMLVPFSLTLVSAWTISLCLCAAELFTSFMGASVKSVIVVIYWTFNHVENFFPCTFSPKHSITRITRFTHFFRRDLTDHFPTDVWFYHMCDAVEGWSLSFYHVRCYITVPFNFFDFFFFLCHRISLQLLCYLPRFSLGGVFVICFSQ